MKLLILMLLLNSYTVLGQAKKDGVGTKVLPSKNMGQTPAPSSGPTDARSTDVAGDDTSSVSPSSSPDPVNTSKPPSRQEQEGPPFDVGPYDKEGNYKVKIEEEESDQPDF